MRNRCFFVLAVGTLAVGWSGCSPDSSAPAGPTDAAPASSALPQPFFITTASGVEMVFLPGGEFVMGSDRESKDEGPAHPVRLSPFLIDKFEVTHEMFAKAELPDPSHWQDDPRKPVEQIRWRDAKQYCNERSLMEGLEPCYDETKPGWPCNFEANGYRLPTEAEWEYAARAGARGRYDFATAKNLKLYAWFDENSQERTHVVGSRKPNRWGLFDMDGNVSEWCQDVYRADYYASSPADNPSGPPASQTNFRRVMRGGSWKASASMCRVTFRQGQRTGDTDACFFTDYCGFRCVRSVIADQVTALRQRTQTPERDVSPSP